MNLVDQYVPLIIEAALNNNKSVTQKAAQDFVRKLELSESSEYDDLVKKITGILNGQKTKVPKKFTRNFQNDAQETDEPLRDTKLFSVKMDQSIDPHILSQRNQKDVDKFIKAFEKRTLLQDLGVKNLNTLLLYGVPGVGKTSLVKYVAAKLKMPIMRVEISQLVSRYLGTTGKNISSIIKYAAENDVILFFDEFDAIAKNRSSDNDLGEIQRVVSVLLTEIENWNPNGILISATNFIEIIDPAIIRRFSTKIEVDLPDDKARKEIWKTYLFKTDFVVNETILNFLTDFSVSMTPALIENISNLAIRDTIVNETDYNENILYEFVKANSNKIKKDPQTRKAIVSFLKSSNLKFSQRTIAEMTGLSKSSIQRI
ncbi:hypothetical protein CRI85_04155 [Leuconostoc pseudomesenteroides]|mgnify:CR=1 FL=1|uniref:AAA family ATPase n=1 Tax=Leuconostoc pseudomesenteroides TaxID=33968 RepID=UPI001E2A83DD|nr:AAA family ATPase [Leuconostoc pseudomesenteroides]MCC8439537.1 hypothetical protein [Leuconostoc pseudomesenteroides]